MAITSEEAIAAVSGGGGGGGAARGPGALNIVDRDTDLGRGRGTRGGGRQSGLTSVGISGRGASGAGYGEDDIATILRGMSPERINAIQKQMQIIGLIPESFRSYGFVDSRTREAFAEILDLSNDRGANWQTTLDGMETAGKAALDEARRAKAGEALRQFEPQARIYKQSDPASVRQTAEQAFQQALGRKPKDEELNRFVRTWQKIEMDEQTAGFDAEDRAGAFAVDQSNANAAAATGGGGQGDEASELQRRLALMLKDSPYKIGLGKTTRSYEEQVRLWNEYQAGRGPLAARPGTSKHGNGRANDLQYIDGDKARQWVLANAAKYGLALPLYDPKKPRSKDESWHVELADGHKYGDGHDHGSSTGGASGAPPSMVVQQADLGAQAIEYAQNVNPDEYQAYQIGGQFNNLISILQRGVGV